MQTGRQGHLRCTLAPPRFVPQLLRPDKGERRTAYGNMVVHEMIMNLPEPLRKAAKKNRLVVVVGAGLSAAAGLPDWPGLLKAMVALARQEERIDRKAEAYFLAECEGDLDKRDLPLCFRLLEAEPKVGRGMMEEWLRQLLRDSGHHPTECHRLLASARFPLVTTNYDCLLEEGFSSHPPRPMVKTWRDLTPVLGELQAGRCFVFKAHGCVNEPGVSGDPGSAILTTDDYKRLWANKAYRFFLGQLFAGHTILFVGYSLADPDFQAVLKQVREIYQPSWQPIYMVMKESLDEKLLRDYQINEIRVEEWDELPGLLRQLAPPNASAVRARWDRFPYNWDLSREVDTLRKELAQGKTSILIHGDENRPPDVLAGAVMLELSRQGYQEMHCLYIEDHLSLSDILEKAENALGIDRGTRTLEKREAALCEQLAQRTAGRRVAFGFLCDRRPVDHHRVWQLVVQLGKVSGVCSHLAMGARAEETVSSWEQSEFIMLPVDDYRWADLTEQDRAEVPTPDLEQVLKNRSLPPRMVQELGTPVPGATSP